MAIKSAYQMPDIFTYVSLMFWPVWSKVVTGNYKSMPGKIFGVQRKCIKEETYPFIVGTETDETVEGVLYFHVSDEDTCRLDLFEGQY